MIRIDFDGYGLAEIKTEDDDYKCNWCAAMIPLGGVSFHQEKTNFDMCATCAGVGLKCTRAVAVPRTPTHRRVGYRPSRV